MVTEKKSMERGKLAELKDPCYKWANPNDEHTVIGDCGVRAIMFAENITYDETEKRLLNKLAEIKFRHVADIYERYLDDKYERVIIPRPKRGESRVTVGEFIRAHPKGRYVLHPAHHLVACVEGIIYDTWNCSNKTCYSAWKIV